MTRLRVKPAMTRGGWSGVTVAWPAGRKNRIGGKAPAAYLRGSFSRTTNTAPKNYDCDENDCAPSAPGSPTRPTGVRARLQSEAAAGVPLRRRVPKRQAPVEALRDEVATMRARNTMRFSAPTREPPGGRPSRGAKLKGRCKWQIKNQQFFVINFHQFFVISFHQFWIVLRKSAVEAEAA